MKKGVSFPFILGLILAVSSVMGFYFAFLEKTNPYIFAFAMVCAALAVMLLGIGLFSDADENQTVTNHDSPALKRTAPASISALASDQLSPDLTEQGEQAVEELLRLYDRIADPEIRGMIRQLEETTRKILDRVAKRPEKRSQVRQFMDYYLPTAVKILNAYYQLESIASPEVQALEAQLEPMLEKLCYTFDRQLDTLLHDEAMDISADITVMEQMLRQEGGGMTMGGT